MSTGCGRETFAFSTKLIFRADKRSALKEMQTLLKTQQLCCAMH